MSQVADLIANHGWFVDYVRSALSEFNHAIMCPRCLAIGDERGSLAIVYCETCEKKVCCDSPDSDDCEAYVLVHCAGCGDMVGCMEPDCGGRTKLMHDNCAKEWLKDVAKSAHTDIKSFEDALLADANSAIDAVHATVDDIDDVDDLKPFVVSCIDKLKELAKVRAGMVAYDAIIEKALEGVKGRVEDGYYYAPLIERITTFRATLKRVTRMVWCLRAHVTE